MVFCTLSTPDVCVATEEEGRNVARYTSRAYLTLLAYGLVADSLTIAAALVRGYIILQYT